MKKLLRTTAALALLWTGHVFAAAPAQVCKSYEQTLKLAKKDAPDLVQVEVSAALRAKVEHDYNAAEPVTHIHITHVYVLSRPHEDKVLLVLVRTGGCIEDAADMPQDSLADLLGQPT